MLLLLSRFSHVQLCVTPWTVAHQAPLSIGFSRQEYWSGLPFPSPMHVCMHAKLLLLCPTLCGPMDSSPPGSSVTGFSRQEYTLYIYSILFWLYCFCCSRWLALKGVLDLHPWEVWGPGYSYLYEAGLAGIGHSPLQLAWGRAQAELGPLRDHIRPPVLTLTHRRTKQSPALALLQSDVSHLPGLCVFWLRLRLILLL